MGSVLRYMKAGYGFEGVTDPYRLTDIDTVQALALNNGEFSTIDQ